MPVLVSSRRRRTLRRDVSARCQAVELSAFRLVGERLLDLSPRGALLACDEAISLGVRIFVSFKSRGRGPWIDAEAEVARIAEGWREHDRGYCVGLRFVEIDRVSRGELIVRLAGVPPPVPARRAP